MREPNKIKLRNCDQEFLDLLALFTKKGAVSLNDLEADLQKKIQNYGTVGGYDDSDLRKLVNDIDNRKAEKTILLDYFNKITDKITLNQLSPELQLAFNNNAESIEGMLANYRKKTDMIGETDLTKDLALKISNIQQAITNINTEMKDGQDVDGMADRIVALEKRTSLIVSNENAEQTNIAAITDAMAKLKDDFAKVSANVGTLNENTVAKNQSLTIDLFEPRIKNDLIAIEKFTPAEIDQLKALVIASSSGSGGTSGGNSSSGSGGGSNSQFFSGVYTDSDEKLALAKSESEPTVYDMKNDIVYTYDATSGTYTKGSSFLTTQEYGGAFIFSTYLKKLYYNNGIFAMNIGSIDEGVDIFDYAIAAGGSKKIEIAWPYKLHTKVLVKDTDTTSRTNGAYINAEGVATLALDDAGITIYNDFTSTLSFRILVDHISHKG